MKIDLIQATLKDKETIQNLGRFYVYDMSRYCGFLKGWQTPSNGLFECIDLSKYWEEPNHYSFLIHVDDELAGFALINKIGNTPDVEWNMGEFFVTSKFQKKGVGRHVAEQIFKQFSGVWEIMQIPENEGAIAFWKKVIGEYTFGQFQQDQKLIPDPTPHMMLILKFDSKCRTLENATDSL